MNRTDFVRQLAAQFNKPSRPQLSSALRIMKGITDPIRVWAAILQSGLLPEAFMQDRRRRYGESSEGELVMPNARPGEHSHPTTMAAVMTVAADPAGLLKAEQWARELARRLAPWKAVCNDEVVWYFTDNPYRDYPHEAVYLGHAFHSAIDTVDWTLSRHGGKLNNTEDGGVAGLPFLLQHTLAAWEGWNCAVSRNMVILEPHWPLDLTRWQRFSDLENPFEPLLNIWCTGYRLVCHFDSTDPTIRLYANPVTNIVSTLLRDHP